MSLDQWVLDLSLQVDKRAELNLEVLNLGSVVEHRKRVEVQLGQGQG